MSVKQVQTTAFSTASTLGLIGGKTIQLQDYINGVFAITAAGSANLTVQVLGSVQETKPDFTIASSATNQYAPVQIIDLDSNTTLNGTTGLVYSGASDGTKQYMINTRQTILRWIGFKITAYTTGNVTITLTVSDNL